MTEIRVKFDLTFSRRFITTVGAVAMVFCAVPELESESVTLSTYYPAPSGVYTNMITTGDTYLARDGGAATRLGVGTTAPAAKVHILGVSQNTLAVDSPAWPEITLRVNGAIKNYNAVVTSAGGYFGGSAVNDWVFRNDGGASTKFGRGGTTDMTLDTNGTINATGSFKATGPFVAMQGSVACSDASYAYPGPGGGTHVLCGGGQYATMIDGFYTRKSVFQVVPAGASNPTVTARCCPCPAGGCVL